MHCLSQMFRPRRRPHYQLTPAPWPETNGFAFTGDVEAQGQYVRYTILENGGQLFIQLRNADGVQAYRLATADGGPFADRSPEALIATGQQVARDLAEQTPA